MSSQHRTVALACLLYMRISYERGTSVMMISGERAPPLQREFLMSSQDLNEALACLLYMRISYERGTSVIKYQQNINLLATS